MEYLVLFKEALSNFVVFLYAIKSTDN